MSETKQEEKVVDGKTITTTEHESGRKDVHIEVKTLDVDLKDPSNAAAKKVIEDKILPALAKRKVTVTLIHKPTNDHFTFIAFVPHVRRYAEQFMRDHAKAKNINGGDPFIDHYCIVQHDLESHEVTVTTL